MLISKTLCPATALAMFLGTTAIAQPQGYMNHSQLTTRLGEIAGSDHASLTEIGKSLGGQPLHLLTLSANDEPDSQPALLIVAGIDAQYLVSTEVATRMAEQLLAEHADQLEGMTVYIVPRANPDGAARNMKSLSMGHAGNARLVDEDRDRMLDEDPGDDLNGDGFITMMRRLEPTLDDAPTHMADPDDPRLNIVPDKGEGQRAVFTLYPEGIDNDDDGVINEDGFGAVDLNQNFMHMWPEHQAHAGRYPLSEPESHALARFVFDHDNIIAAITIGKHDNLINQPDAKSTDITGRAPKGIDAKDAGLYKEAGEWFKEATGMDSADKGDPAGSFYSWLYAQRGLPSFAVQPWTRPDADNGDDKEEGKSGEAPKQPEGNNEPRLTPSPVGDISQETLDELTEAYIAMTGEEPDPSMIASITPEMVEQYAAQAGIEVRRVQPAQDQPEQTSEAKGEKKTKKKLSEDAKWLAYFEQAGIEGFVDWQPYDHPTLGKVEIGGFISGAKINPPATDLDELASKHTEFAAKLLGAKPEVEVLGPEIEDLGGGLYEVRIALVNNGDLPTSTVFARSTRTVKPMVVRLSADVDRIITGQRVDRIWGLDQDGGRSEHRWVFRSDDIGAESIEIVDPRFGNRTIKLSN